MQHISSQSMKPKDRSRNNYELLDDNNERDTNFTKIRDCTALFSFTTKAHLILLILALLCSCITGALDPALAVLLGRFFSSLSEFGGGSIDADTLMANSLTSIHGIIAIGIMKWVFQGGFLCLWITYGETQAKSVRDLLFHTLLQKDIAWYEAHKNGMKSLLLRLQTQIRELQTGISQPLGFVCMCIMQALISIGVAFYYSWKLTLVILSAAPLIAFVISFIQKGLLRARDAEETALNMATTIIANAFTNIVTIKCSNTQRLECSRYGQSLSLVASHYGKQAYINAVEIGFSRFTSTAVVVAGVMYGIVLVHQDQFTTAGILTAFWSCLAAANALEDILPHLLALRKGHTSASILKAIVDQVTRPSETSEARGYLCPDNLEGEIEFRNVFFAYPSHSTRFLLRNTSCTFSAGKLTFLVGQSGSGKSTIGNLLLKFCSPQSGTILIDGHDIQKLNTSWLRNNITLVQQQAHIYEGTVYENVALCRPEYTRNSSNDIEESLKFASVSQSMSNFVDGSNTKVGCDGSGISGGQRQRIALARARLRDTRILILDESTSALDSVSRISTMQKIRAWREGKTTIIITHDLTQVTATDLLYVLKEGQLVTMNYHDIAAGLVKNKEFWTRNTSHQARTEDIAEPVKNPSIPSTPRPAFRNKRRQGSQDSLDRVLSLYQIDQSSANASRITRSSSRIGKSSERLKWSDPASMGSSVHNASSEASTLIFNLLPKYQDTLVHRPSQPISRSVRPISMHHAVITRRLYDQLNENKLIQPEPAKTEIPSTGLLSSSKAERPSKGGPQHQRSSNRRWSLTTIFGTIWPVFSWKEKLRLSLGLLATIVHGLCPPVFSYLLTKLFTTLYLQNDWQSSARTFALILVGAALLDGTTAFLLHYIFESIGQNWINALRNNTMKGMMRLPKAWFDELNNDSSRICSILDRDANETRNLLGRFAAPIIVVIVMTAGTLIFAFTLCWKTTLVSLASAPLMYAVTELFGRVSSHWEALTNEYTSQVIGVFTEAFSDIRTLRALTLESHFHRKYTKATSRAFAIGLRRAIYTGVLFGLSDAMLLFVTAALFTYGATLVRSGSYSVESIMTVFALLLFGMATATSVIAYIPQLSSSVDSASRLLDLATMPIVSHETQGMDILDRTDSSSNTGLIQFIDQTFHYPSRPDDAALRNVSFTIPHNSYTAIVGTSGSGKSTIASLLTGLYSQQVPPAGTQTSSNNASRILISGRDIRTLSTPHLRAITGYVSQNPSLLQGTIRENILYGLSQTSDDTALLHAAAKSASIHDFIQSLPNGYDTPTGEGGQPLSGGQAQRIAIARAIARVPRILILDEATSALDRANMDVIKRTLLRLVRELGCTVIVITHAWEMVEHADHVVVLEKGSVVGEGKVDDLLEQHRWLWSMMTTSRSGNVGDREIDDTGYEYDDPGEGPSGTKR